MPYEGEGSNQSISTLCSEIPNLEFEFNDYRDEVDQLNWSEDQKQEFLKIMWDIIMTSVRLGWGVETSQLILSDIFEISKAEEEASSHTSKKG